MRVYFDHNATTPVDPTVVDVMSRVLLEDFGNPSSIHHFGQRAKGILDDARTAIADLVKAEVSEVVFTSGGTEADNFAIRGVAEALEVTGRRHLIASAIEHEAVLNTLKALARRGWRTTLVPVDQSGVASPDRVRDALSDDTALVSVMHANNEIGTIQPIAEIAALAPGSKLAAAVQKLQAMNVPKAAKPPVTPPLRGSVMKRAFRSFVSRTQPITVNPGSSAVRES